VDCIQAMESLDHASKMIRTSQDARNFAENHMTALVGILLAKQPTTLELAEINSVQKALESATDIVLQDLMIQMRRNADCRLLPTLAHVFDRKKRFYSTRGISCHAAMKVVAKVRESITIRFLESNGFTFLHRYMEQKAGTPAFPHPFLVRHILTALADGLLIPPSKPKLFGIDDMRLDSVRIATTVMKSINSMSNIDLNKMPVDQLRVLLQDLQEIFDVLMTTDRTSTLDFYTFWFV
jgi:hypothetical protein